jgi:hypothetical protein
VLPKVFGQEGSGVAVASGGGLLAHRMVGQKVGVCGVPTWQVGQARAALGPTCRRSMSACRPSRQAPAPWTRPSPLKPQRHSLSTR